MDASLFTTAIERHKHDLVSQISTIAEQIYGANADNENDANTKQQKLRLQLSEVFNQAIKKVSRTDTREVTILLSDLRGFTALSENYSASSLIELLNRYFSKMCEIIVTQHRGRIDKFMGDSIMALFGAPETAADDLERTLSCAIQMQIAMDDINAENEVFGIPQLFMGIGINTGIVVAGELGSELHSEYTVIGEEVNLASRIEAYSLRGQILISENTYQHAKDYITTGPANQVFVKGKIDPINFYELLAINRPTPMMVPLREIRKSPRVEVNMPFTFQILSGKKILPENYNGNIIDISYNGFLAIIPMPVPVFTDIKLTMTLSILGVQTSDVYAKNLCVKEKDKCYQANVEFTCIHPQAKASIQTFINQIIQCR